MLNKNKKSKLNTDVHFRTLTIVPSTVQIEKQMGKENQQNGCSESSDTLVTCEVKFSHVACISSTSVNQIKLVNSFNCLLCISGETMV